MLCNQVTNMRAVVEPTHLLVGVPGLQFVQRVSSSRGQGQQQRQRRRRTRCEYREGWNPDPQKDTRIHWSSPDEGWVGGTSQDRQGTSSSVLDDLLTSFSAPLDSHYEFLGLRPDTDVEGIKVAYRKLSKLYHPDTTALPIDVAAQKFLRLQKAYDVLSSVEERRFYDWNLAQNISRQEGGGFVWPYEAEQTLKGPGFQTRFTDEAKSDDVYIDFSGQMLAGLFFDGFALTFSILTIIYVAFFRH